MELKKGTNEDSSRLSQEVIHNIQLTHHFLDDMQLLANLLKDFEIL